MTEDVIYDVLTRLVGSVTPCGDTRIDTERLENMRIFIAIFHQMHMTIDDVAYRFKNSQRHSEKLIGELADKHIQSMGIED